MDYIRSTHMGKTVNNPYVFIIYFIEFTSICGIIAQCLYINREESGVYRDYYTTICILFISSLNCDYAGFKQQKQRYFVTLLIVFALHSALSYLQVRIYEVYLIIELFM